MKTKTVYRFLAVDIWLMLIWLGFSAYFIFSGKRFPYIIMYGSVLIIALSFFYFITELKKAKKRYNEYEEGQYLEKWYQDTVKKNGFDWIRKTGHKINLMYPGKDLKILSVAANKGTYEKEMYKDMITYCSKVHMIVTEIGKMEHEENSKDGISEYEYLSDINAFNCENLLIAKDLDKVDVVLDFKGALWYELTRKGEPQKLINAYYNILTEKGSIIIDHGRVPVLRKVICYLRHVLLGLPASEPSTYFYLLRKTKKDPEFEKWIKKMFTFEIFEADENINILILKKRAV